MGLFQPSWKKEQISPPGKCLQTIAKDKRKDDILLPISNPQPRDVGGTYLLYYSVDK